MWMNLEQKICVQICALLLHIQLYRKAYICIYIVLEREAMIKDHFRTQVIITVLAV